MHATTSSSNRHIVDQLADIRDVIKSLQIKEADLKDEVAKQMGKNDSLGGNEFIAYQTVNTRKGGIDEAELKRRGVDIPRKPETVVYSLRLQRRAMGGD